MALEILSASSVLPSVPVFPVYSMIPVYELLSVFLHSALFEDLRLVTYSIYFCIPTK